jgi:hypothetical protein
MHCVAERIQKCPEARRYDGAAAEPFEVNQICCRNHDVFGERAVQMHTLDAYVLADVPPARGALLAMTAEDVHLSGRIVSDSSNTRVNVLADLDHLAAELMADDDRLVARRVTAVIGQHFISHSLAGSDLVDALISATDGGRFYAELDLGVSHARLRFIAHKLQAVFEEALFF